MIITKDDREIELMTEAGRIVALVHEKLKEDIVNGDGTIDEIAEVRSITFYDSWNEIILLEVLAKNIELV